MTQVPLCRCSVLANVLMFVHISHHHYLLCSWFGVTWFDQTADDESENVARLPSRDSQFFHFLMLMQSFDLFSENE